MIGKDGSNYTVVDRAKLIAHVQWRLIAMTDRGLEAYAALADVVETRPIEPASEEREREQS